MSEKRNAIVTGGGSGIGRAVALALARDGWTVAIAGRRKAALEAVAAEAAGEMLSFEADVTDEGSVDALFDGAVARLNRLDLLFNNAGINVPAVPLDELAVADLRAIIDTNLFGAMLCARKAMGAMRAQDPQGGRIVNNGSISAQVPRPFSAPYTATKHAITGLTKSLALDGRACNVVCSQIDIGNAVTEMSAYMDAGALQANGTVSPEPRMSVEHVADAVVHIARLPLEANISFMTIMASRMPLYGRG